MKFISIDERLSSIANMVDPCNIIADIGTDHGYLPIYLIQSNKVKKAIASDVAIGPLNKAKENIAKYELSDVITTILCDGLSKIPSQVDVVIMAGMGANLIAEIITQANYKYDTYILQANLNVNFLRKYLSENGFEIIDETVTFSHKKFYEILKVKQGHKALTENEIKYGPINLIKKEKLFVSMWENISNNYKKILVDFKGSKEEFDRITKEINDIDDMLKAA